MDHLTAVKSVHPLSSDRYVEEGGQDGHTHGGPNSPISRRVLWPSGSFLAREALVQFVVVLRLSL